MNTLDRSIFTGSPEPSENENSCITFCANVFGPIPSVVFELSAVLQSDASLSGRILPDRSFYSVTYHRKDRVYTSVQDEEPFTPTNSLVTLELNYDPDKQMEVFSIGLGLASDALVQHPIRHMLSFASNELLNLTYHALRTFFELNTGKYNDNPFCYTTWSPRAVTPADIHHALSTFDSYIVLDTEMQGDRLIQFAGQLLHWNGTAFEKTDELALYIKLPHGERVWPKIQSLTSITDALLYYKGEPLRTAAPKIQSFLSKGDIICGQSVKFDIDILSDALESQGLALPQVLAQNEFIDIAPTFQFLYNRKSYTSLEITAELLGISANGMSYHDAVTDTYITAEIFKTLSVAFAGRSGILPVIDYWMDLRPEGKGYLLIPPTFKKPNPITETIRKNMIRSLSFNLSA